VCKISSSIKRCTHRLLSLWTVLTRNTLAFFTYGSYPFTMLKKKYERQASYYMASLLHRQTKTHNEGCTTTRKAGFSNFLWNGHPLCAKCNSAHVFDPSEDCKATGLAPTDCQCCICGANNRKCQYRSIAFRSIRVALKSSEVI